MLKLHAIGLLVPLVVAAFGGRRWTAWRPPWRRLAAVDERRSLPSHCARERGPPALHAHTAPARCARVRARAHGAGDVRRFVEARRRRCRPPTRPGCPAPGAARIHRTACRRSSCSPSQPSAEASATCHPSRRRSPRSIGLSASAASFCSRSRYSRPWFGLRRGDARPVVWTLGAVELGVLAWARPVAPHYLAPSFVLAIPAALWLLQTRTRARDVAPRLAVRAV